MGGQAFPDPSIFLARPYEVIIAKRPVSALPPCVVNEGMRNT